jgi:methylamine--corrinoid protein Co-methyltransferase
MIPLIDFQERALKGPVMKTDEFDMAFAMKVREVVKKYGIEHNLEELLVDDETADNVFHAGVDLLAGVGLYHLNTQRVVKLTKDEILELARERQENPGKATFGKGSDEMTIAYRTGKDPRPPTLYAGVGGVITEEEFGPYVRTFAGERRIEGMGISGGIQKVGDVEPKAGTLSEIYCGLWEQEQLQKALEDVGRPGMNLGLLCTVSTVGATLHCMASGFRGPHNTQIGIHIVPEQKIDWDRLLLAKFCRDQGIVPWQSAMSMIGGFCRHGADAAVGLVANALGQLSYGNGPMCSLFPTNLDGTWATRDCIWAVGAAARASERNIRLAIGSAVCSSYEWGGTVAGVLQEAVEALAYTASGFTYAWIAGESPRIAIMIGDLMAEAAEMGPEKAAELAGKVMTRLEELKKQDQPRATILTFSDVYDLKRMQFRPEYTEALDRAEEELSSLGVPLRS